MHHDTSSLNIDNPHVGIFLTIFLALTTVTTGVVGFLQNVDLIAGIVLKLVGICAGFSTIIAAYYTVKASKRKLEE